MNSSEQRNCQNCKKHFIIEPEDFDFYKKIQVPPPTWCPECRMIRRMLWRNECIWYRRKCDATGKDILSMYSPDPRYAEGSGSPRWSSGEAGEARKPYKVYANEYWKSDAWDPLEYGREYNFSKSFFTQFDGLLRAVPHPNLVQKNMVNSEYANYALNQKNCYFVGGSDAAEDCAYMFGSNLHVRDCFDTYRTADLESCYEVMDCRKSSRLFFAQNCVGCSDSAFLYDCRNCTNCFGCAGLRNKQFHIWNEPHSKEAYAAAMKLLDIGSSAGADAARAKFEALKAGVPRRFAWILQSQNVVGDDLSNARNCKWCFSVGNSAENCRYSYRLFEAKDGYDGFVAWNGAELFYEVFSVSGQRVLCSALIWGGFDIQYSYNCFDCNNIFGCVGLRNKSYCVLNKQYSEAEYLKLVPRIIAQMGEMKYIDREGRVYGYGEFFPPQLCPFVYNETVAQDNFPKDKAEALEEGFGWREMERREHKATKSAADFPPHITDVPDSVVGEVIECAHGDPPTGGCADQCATAFRIVPQELQFLKKSGIALPRFCPLCRRGERIRMQNPLRLWHRTCMCAGTQSKSGEYKNTVKHFHGDAQCPNEFETPYAPGRKEIVYCESCYNAEVV